MYNRIATKKEKKGKKNRELHFFRSIYQEASGVQVIICIMSLRHEEE